MGRLGNRSRRRAIAKRLQPPTGAAIAYRRALLAIMNAFHADAFDWLTPRLGQLTVDDKTAAKTHLSSTWMGHVDGLVRKLAGKVVDPFARLSAAVVRNSDAAFRALGLDVRGQLGPELGRILERNQQLITGAGREFASDVAGVLDDPLNYGLRHEELAAILRKRADVSDSRAELIARDQTSKLSGSINQFRQVHAGVASYIWSGSLDERERETHLANEGKEFDWNNPPEETGHPTEDVQCRCVAIPMIPELEELSDET